MKQTLGFGKQPCSGYLGNKSTIYNLVLKEEYALGSK